MWFAQPPPRDRSPGDRRGRRHGRHGGLHRILDEQHDDQLDEQHDEQHDDQLDEHHDDNPPAGPLRGARGAADVRGVAGVGDRDKAPHSAPAGHRRRCPGDARDDAGRDERAGLDGAPRRVRGLATGVHRDRPDGHRGHRLRSRSRAERACRPRPAAGDRSPVVPGVLSAGDLVQRPHQRGGRRPLRDGHSGAVFLWPGKPGRELRHALSRELPARQPPAERATAGVHESAPARRGGPLGRRVRRGVHGAWPAWQDVRSDGSEAGEGAARCFAGR